MRAVHAPGATKAETARLPARAGAGFKAEHFADIAQSRPDIGFFEVHAENFMGAGGPPHAQFAHIWGTAT